MKTIITSMICVSILSSCSYQQKLARAERKIERLAYKYPELRKDVSIPVTLEYVIPEYEVSINAPLTINENVVLFCDSVKKGKAPIKNITRYVNAEAELDTLDLLITAKIVNGILTIKAKKKAQTGQVSGEADTQPIVINKKSGWQGLEYYHWIILILAFVGLWFLGFRMLDKWMSRG